MRQIISKEDAIAVADAAWEYICLLCYDLLGYDLRHNCALKNGGLFGYLQYIIYQCLEVGSTYICFAKWKVL
jgi:hypothetical protein